MRNLRTRLKQLMPRRIADTLRVWKFSAERYAFFPGPLTYRADGLATSHNFDFARDARFAHAYALGERTGSWGGGDVRWRAHVVCWAADWARRLDGDFVECGVNKGGYARMIIEYVDFAKLLKRFYLLDTFKGLSDQYISDEERALGRQAGGYEECYAQVIETFKPFANVVIIRGTVPDTLPLVHTQRVAFLSIDMNVVIPEIAAAEFFWDKLVPGAIMVLDDYGHPDHFPQKRALDEFARGKQVQILTLPTAQGLILKPSL